MPHVPWWSRWLAILRATVRPRAAARDLHEEITFHVEMQAAVNAKRGMSDAEARRRARLAIGGVEQAKERTQDMRPLRWFDVTAQDVRYALRSLGRAPGFTVVAVLTLGLGIGANTAIFSMVNGVVLRPLPYPKPAELMHLTTQFPELGLYEFRVSPPEYFEFRELTRSFSDVAAYVTGEASLTAGDRAMNVRATFVDDHMMNTLGVRAESGRVFAAGEADIAGPPPAPGQPRFAPAVAMLSHELWQSAFGGRPLVGEKIEVGGRRFQVVGILPAATDVMDNRTDIWMPLGLNPANRQNRGNHFLYLVGRLNDGVTQQAGEQELNLLMATWGDRVGIKRDSGHIFSPLNGGRGHILQMKPLQSAVLGTAGRSIWMLQIAVGLVLLIACANLANLLLARAETRRREFAVRSALGAARGRLLRQFVTEGILLALLGGAVGVLLARIGLQTLLRAYPASLPRAHDVRIDRVVLLFTFSLSTVTGVLFGLAPFIHTRVHALANALRDSGSRGAHSTARRYVRGVLVSAEVALAVMLVTGAGLLARSVYNLADVDAGFDRARLVTFSMTLTPAQYRLPGARVQLYQRLLEKLRAIPGVHAASAMSGLPPVRTIDSSDTQIEGYAPVPRGPLQNVDYYQNVMTDYFETMGIPIVRGRSFQRADIGASGLVAVVNEALANTFWKGQDPIGKRLRICCSQQFPWFTVVGVAKDVRQGGLEKKAGTEFYFFVDQTSTAPPAPGLNLGGFGLMNIVLRTTLPATALSQTIERVVRETDRTIPIVRFREMSEVFDDSISRPRLLAQLIGVFAGLALLLAAVGTYGVLAYMVTEQRREIGIRLALGADRARVLAGVMKHGLALTFAGVMMGVAGALGANKLLASLLFGVRPSDPAILTGVVATIAVVAALACWLPAWRASRVDPGVVLRDE